MKSCAIGIALVGAVMAAGCETSGPPATPTSATPAQSPFVTQFGGFWDGTLTLARISGGECVGQDYLSEIGSQDVGTVVIAQSRTDVTAVIRSATTGLSCRYGGTAGPGAFALSTQACEVEQILFRCSNGAARVLEQVGSTVTATLSGTAATGTVATWYNVFSDSTEEELRRPVAGLIVEQQFTAFRR